MKIETVSDLAEKIADWLGVYGACKNNTGYNDFDCKWSEENPICCRSGFVSEMIERIFKSVENSEKIEKYFDK